MKEEKVFVEFYDICKVVQAAFDREWRGAEEWEKEEKLRSEKNAIIGYEEETGYYKEKIKAFIKGLELENVKSSDYFDINPFTKYYYELKIAAIKSLDYNEFLEFFCYEDYPKTFKKNKKAFNLEMYKKISPYLKDDTKIFWDSLYLEVSGIDIRNSNLFSKDEEPLRVIKKANNYLDEFNYNNLKNNIKLTPNFYQSNIVRLDKKLNKQYDIIMLSNIAQYIEGLFDKNHLENLKEVILKLEDKLKDNGIIIVSYLYDIYGRYDYNNTPLIYDLRRVRNVIRGLEIIDFEGIQNLKFEASKNIKDGILIYKKTK